MTEENLKLGNDILKKIKSLEEEKKYWEAATKFSRVEIKYGTIYENMEKDVDPSMLNFEEIKLLTLAKISKLIEELKSKFSNL